MMETCIDNFQRTKTGKGGFWKDFTEKTELSRSTVREWYIYERDPEHPEDLKKVAQYLGCELEAFLTPIAAEKVTLSNTAKEEKIEKRIDRIIRKKKVLRVDFFELLSYLVVFKGNQVNVFLLWRILKGKLIPSVKLCDEIEELLDTIEKNCTNKKLNPINMEHQDFATKEKVKNRCIINRIKIQQLNLQKKLIIKYLNRIKNYKISYLDFLKILYGFASPTEIFLADLENILDCIETDTMTQLFSVTKKEKNYAVKKKNINRLYATSRSIPIIFTLGKDRIIKRDYQIRKIRNYAKHNKIVLKEEGIHFYRDSTWYDLKNACNLVEAGYYDSIVLYDRTNFASEKIEETIMQYVIAHNIPIIFVEDMYYIE